MLPALRQIMLGTLEHLYTLSEDIKIYYQPISKYVTNIRLDDRFDTDMPEMI